MAKCTVIQRIRDAYNEGRGVRLSEADVVDLYGPDDALHMRAYHDDERRFEEVHGVSRETEGRVAK